ncbi:MAG: hypothetical protein PHD33_04540 [Atribacterota bacterium]|nr:hypothetical protein [Atribacterota bacterium]
MGKKVFLRIKNRTHAYQGEVIEVTCELKPNIWITILDKFNKIVTFSIEEILEIKEEE